VLGTPYIARIQRTNFSGSDTEMSYGFILASNKIMWVS